MRAGLLLLATGFCSSSRAHWGSTDACGYHTQTANGTFYHSSPFTGQTSISNWPGSALVLRQSSPTLHLLSPAREQQALPSSTSTQTVSGTPAISSPKPIAVLTAATLALQHSRIVNLSYKIKNEKSHLSVHTQGSRDSLRRKV